MFASGQPLQIQRWVQKNNNVRFALSVEMTQFSIETRMGPRVSSDQLDMSETGTHAALVPSTCRNFALGAHTKL